MHRAKWPQLHALIVAKSHGTDSSTRPKGPRSRHSRWRFRFPELETHSGFMFQLSRRVQTVGFQLGKSWSGLKSVMSETSKAWDGELVRKWLQSRFEAARLEQAAADKRGYEAQDDYDKAAAEEWVCQSLKTAGRTGDQAAFAAQLKELLAQDEYRTTGIYDDRRFDRYVRATLRKIANMTNANDGFANTLRYQG